MNSSSEIKTNLDKENFKEHVDSPLLLDKVMSLNSYLTYISALINEFGTKNVWVTAEITYISEPKKGHYYLELVEHENKTNFLAKIQGIIWKSKSKEIFDKFKLSTGQKLLAGINVLLKVKANYHPLYGIKLIINDIDPSFTIGGMVSNIADIRSRLRKKQIYHLNKNKALPADIKNVAVIAPKNSAGLGDFLRESNILSKYNFCSFEYFSSYFQGKNSAQSIWNTINKIEDGNFDVIVIIRGGGSVLDLAWLNDYNLSEKICLCKIPIFVGLGHNKDKTIIDEVASNSFDSPSKVSSYIFYYIIGVAKKYEEELHKVIRLLEEKIKKINNILFDIINNINSCIYSYAFIISKNNEINYNFISSNLVNQAYSASLKLDKKINYISNSFLNLLRLKNTDIRICLQSLLFIKNKIRENNINIVNMYNMIFLLSKNLIKVKEYEIRKILDIIEESNPQKLLRKGFLISVTSKNSIITSLKEAVKQDVIKIRYYDGELLVRKVKEV